MLEMWQYFRMAKLDSMNNAGSRKPNQTTVAWAASLKVIESGLLHVHAAGGHAQFILQHCDTLVVRTVPWHQMS